MGHIDFLKSLQQKDSLNRACPILSWNNYNTNGEKQVAQWWYREAGSDWKEIETHPHQQDRQNFLLGREAIETRMGTGCEHSSSLWILFLRSFW